MMEKLSCRGFKLLTHFKAVYTKPYIKHGSMGPVLAELPCTIGEILHICVTCQGIYPMRRAIAECWKWMKKKSMFDCSSWSWLLWSSTALIWCRCGCAILALNYPNKHIRVSRSREELKHYVGSFWVSHDHGLEGNWWRMERSSLENRHVWNGLLTACGPNDDPATLLWPLGIKKTQSNNSERVFGWRP